VRVEGRALKFGDNVNTDLILPGKYLVLTRPEDLAAHAMEGLDPGFPRKAQEYGLVVAGVNFGGGSSREHAALALKHAGVRCVVAESFARIFFRNAINNGLPAVACPGISSKVEEGDRLEVELEKGLVTNKSKGVTLQAKPFPGFLLGILRDGGLIPHLNKKHSENKPSLGEGKPSRQGVSSPF
jgi:3-isopropylmalate/(R)-2-methylmalate dehydratase small subunit